MKKEEDITAIEKMPEKKFNPSMRQWYKGMAMQGLLASFREGDAVAPDPFNWLSSIAAKYADCMLAEDLAHEKEDK